MAGESGTDALDPAVRHLQFPLLDSLRGLAAISILVVHVSIFSQATANPLYGRFLGHLDIGVPFFFLLSAFLLYRPFVLARVRGTSRTSFGTYARRRFVRIAPAYWAVLTITALVPGFAGAFSGNWWVYYGLLQNLPVYTPESACTANAFRCGVPVAWSLSVEVGFYLALPLLVLVMDRIQRSRRGPGWLGAELGAALAIMLVSIGIQSQTPDSDLKLWLFYSPLGRGWWFGLGLALAALSVWVSERDTEPAAVTLIARRPAVLVAAGACLYVFSCLVMNDSLLAFPLVPQREFLAQYLLVGLIAALVLTPAIFGQAGGGGFRRLLAHPWLTWLGLISYGIFLWQIPVLIVLFDAGILGIVPRLDFPILLLSSFAGTVLCAAISYYTLERPLMRRFRGRTRQAILPPSERIVGQSSN